MTRLILTRRHLPGVTAIHVDGVLNVTSTAIHVDGVLDVTSTAHLTAYLITTRQSRRVQLVLDLARLRPAGTGRGDGLTPRRWPALGRRPLQPGRPP
ncbi:hypothetical protein [Nonomuraea monospora]